MDLIASEEEWQTTVNEWFEELDEEGRASESSGEPSQTADQIVSKDALSNIFSCALPMLTAENIDTIKRPSTTMACLPKCANVLFQ